MKKKLVSVILVLTIIFAFAIGAEGCKKEAKEELHGEFYTLQEAYEAKLLTQEDLISIAYYYHSRKGNSGREGNEELMNEDYTPIPKTPSKLNSATTYAIRKDFWEKYCVPSGEDTSLDDVGIGESMYFGTYNNCVAVMVGRAGHYYDWFKEDVVAGVHFLYPDNNRILIWKEGDKVQGFTPLSDGDKAILNYHHPALINENFEDNEVNVILKSYFSSLKEISFKDFEIVEQVAEISAIEYGLKTITNKDERLLLEGEKNLMFTLKLAVNDKATVLAAIEQVQKLDMVLAAEPSYIYDIVFD